VIALYQSRHASRSRLSAEEIAVIGEKISRDYAPRYSNSSASGISEIKFSTKELLAISDEISREFSVHPPQYVSQSVCVLMPVDLNHLHAYWYLDKKQQQTVNNKGTDKALVLRVFRTHNKDSDIAASAQHFDLIFDNTISQQTISLPQMSAACDYSAAIGQFQDNQFVAFAFSDTTYLSQEGVDSFEWLKKKPKNTVISRFLNQNFSGKGKISR